MNKSHTLLAILLISGITVANAFDNPSTTMAVLKNGSTFRLLYKGIKQSDVKVLILNDENRIVFSEKIKSTDGFARPYNFSNLPEGHYSIQVKDGISTRTETVNYHIKKEERTMHLMRFQGSTRYVLSVPNKGTDDLSITIFNDLDEVIYKTRENVSGDFARIYNLGEHSGNFRFVVTDGNGQTKSVTK
ncbi:MAG TPA: hypothetical protein VFZ52_07635 [Chryseolinea sp.]